MHLSVGSSGNWCIAGLADLASGAAATFKHKAAELGNVLVLVLLHITVRAL